MQVDVKMTVVAGDESKAVVKMYDEHDLDLGGEVVLDSTTSHTMVTIPTGGHCVVMEFEPPIVYNPETCGAEYEKPEDVKKKKAEAEQKDKEHLAPKATDNKEHSAPKAPVPPASPRPKM